MYFRIAFYLQMRSHHGLIINLQSTFYFDYENRPPNDWRNSDKEAYIFLCHIYIWTLIFSVPSNSANKLVKILNLDYTQYFAVYAFFFLVENLSKYNITSQGVVLTGLTTRLAHYSILLRIISLTSLVGLVSFLYYPMLQSLTLSANALRKIAGEMLGDQILFMVLIFRYTKN